ncbi:riboflavin synthase [Sphingomonas flavalba]|uniref:riboflavin synthase n=1 Tax=Sphingomonas flavalba TaxID=2559804 RepID=UPI0039E0110D
MFTGIITDIGRIEAVETRGDRRLTIACGYDMAGVAIGASIACSGACLTVVAKDERHFTVAISAESIARTAPGMWETGQRLNLERAMRVGDELGGHIVTGHVDGIGRVSGLRDEGDSIRLTVTTDAALAPYIAAKGSIALDGVSLTVNSVEDHGGDTAFGLNIIPHTAAATTFDALTIGRALNIEIDILARYLGRMEQYRAKR